MTNKITGCAASHDDNANISVARESVQRLGERVAHLLVETDAPCAAERNDRNSIGYSCRQNIGVHRVLLSCDELGWLERRQTTRLRADLVAKEARIDQCPSGALRAQPRTAGQSG